MGEQESPPQPAKVLAEEDRGIGSIKSVKTIFFRCSGIQSTESVRHFFFFFFFVGKTVFVLFCLFFFFFLLFAAKSTAPTDSVCRVEKPELSLSLSRRSACLSRTAGEGFGREGA